MIELIRSPCTYPLIKGFTDVGTGQPQFDVVHFFDHRALCTLAGNRPTKTGREPTLIRVRRTLAEVNSVLAGVTPVDSFARFKAPMTVFGEERASFCPWVPVAMVKMQDSWGKTVDCEDCREESRPYVTGMGVARLAQTDPHKQTLRPILGTRWCAVVREGICSFRLPSSGIRSQSGTRWRAMVHENADSGSQGGVES